MTGDHLTKDEVEPSCELAAADVAADANIAAGVVVVPHYASAVATPGKVKV